LLAHQKVKALVDSIPGAFDALSQLDPVRLKQRHIKEVAPVSRIIRRHARLLRLNRAILADLGPIVKLIVRF
jgi:hypothetical protein